MKRLSIISIISFLILFSCTTEVAIDKNAETKAIQNVVESFFVSLGDFDAETMKSYITEDFLAFDLAKIMNIDDMVSALAEFKEMGITDLNYSIELVKSDVFEKNALFCYKNAASAKMGEQEMSMEFIESCFMLKTETGWKVKFLHSTQVPPPAPPNPDAE
ncbi:MAG: hypothetical protein E4G95_03195 [Bacteroidia bacterium]|nr:MAG: hypothetical protein E4G95_03195 [Bacteroidia bacterium]